MTHDMRSTCAYLALSLYSVANPQRAPLLLPEKYYTFYCCDCPDSNDYPVHIRDMHKKKKGQQRRRDNFRPSPPSPNPRTPSSCIPQLHFSAMEGSCGACEDGTLVLATMPAASVAVRPFSRMHSSSKILAPSSVLLSFNFRSSFCGRTRQGQRKNNREARCGRRDFAFLERLPQPATYITHALNNNEARRLL